MFPRTHPPKNSCPLFQRKSLLVALLILSYPKILLVRKRSSDFKEEKQVFSVQSPAPPLKRPHKGTNTSTPLLRGAEKSRRFLVFWPKTILNNTGAPTLSLRKEGVPVSPRPPSAGNNALLPQNTYHSSYQKNNKFPRSSRSFEHSMTRIILLLLDLPPRGQKQEGILLSFLKYHLDIRREILA